MRKGSVVIQPRETIPRKAKCSFIKADEIRMIKKALKREKPLKKNVKSFRKRAEPENEDAQKSNNFSISEEDNYQSITGMNSDDNMNNDKEINSFHKVNETNFPLHTSRLNMSGLSHFMELEERKDLLMNNVDDPLCINGPETYDAVGWVPIKQEIIDDDDLEVSRVTITELPFIKPIEEERVFTSINSPPMYSKEDDSYNEVVINSKEDNRVMESTDKNVLKESNTNEEIVKNESKTVVGKDDDDSSWDPGRETQDDENDDGSESNDIDDDSSKKIVMSTKWKDKIHTCDICDKTLSSKGNLRIHKKKKHQVVVKFHCELCSLNFDLQRELIKHRNEEHRGKDGRFACKECGKFFCDYRGFLMHLKSHFDDVEVFHKGEGCFKCDECEKVFTREEGLQLHKAVSHNSGSAFGEKLKQQQKNYVCSTCGKRFAFGCLLRDHVNLHTGSRPYLCQLCGRSFAQKASLKQHTRTHNSVRPFKCGVCNQGFYGKGDLKKHSRKHTGERPYVCEMCGDGFSQSSHLGVHRRSHTGERPFKCDVCSRGFAKKGDVVRHRRIHTGELPYLCQVCGKAFRQSTQCVNHIKNHHPDAHETVVAPSNTRNSVFTN